jgi:hypothetical protein
MQINQVIDPDSFLKLDQTTPQSVINGVPNFPDINIVNNNTQIGQVFDDRLICGIPDSEKSKWTLSYVASTRIFTITLSSASYYYVDGIRYNLTSGAHNWTAHTNSTNVYFFYFDNTGTPQTSSIPWDLLHTCQVSYVIFNTANDGGGADGIIAYELHGPSMSSASHNHHHFADGTEYISGGSLSGYTLNTDTVAGISWGMSSALFDDEDIRHTSPIQPESNYLLGYLSASNGFNWRTVSTIPIISNGTNIMYDQIGVGLTAVTGNTVFVNYYTILVNDNTPAQRILTIPNQTIYGTLAQAQAESPTSLNLGNLPYQEFVFLYQITYERANAYSSTTGHSRIAATPVKLNLTRVSLTTSSPSQHNSLAGLQGGTSGEYYHLTNSEYSGNWGTKNLQTTGTLNTGEATFTGSSSVVTIPNPTGAASSASEYSGADWPATPIIHHVIRIYAYKYDENRTRYYSSGYSTASYTNSGLSEFDLNWIWDAQSGIDGFRILLSIDNGSTFTKGYDTTATSVNDLHDGTPWDVTKTIVTPSSSVEHQDALSVIGKSNLQGIVTSFLRGGNIKGFCKVSYGEGQGSETNYLLNTGTIMFSTLPFFSIYDPYSNYDISTDTFIAPISGIYYIQIDIRITDNSIPDSCGSGFSSIHANNFDTPDNFQWTPIWATTLATNRISLLPYSRLLHLQEGESYRANSYSDNLTYSSDGTMNIVLLYAD